MRIHGMRKQKIIDIQLQSRVIKSIKHKCQLNLTEYKKLIKVNLYCYEKFPKEEELGSYQNGNPTENQRKNR